MIESIIKKCENSKSLEDLIKNYIEYSNSKYIIEYDGISNVLDSLRNRILLELNNMPLVDVIDLYGDLYIKALQRSEVLKSFNSLIKIREENIKDEKFIEGEAKRRGISREKFVNEYYVETVKSSDKQLDGLNKSLSFIDKLRIDIALLIDNKIDNMGDSEKDNLLAELDKKVEVNEKEIEKLKRSKILSKYIDISSEEIYMNFIKLKIKTYGIYDIYRVMLRNKKNKK